MTRFHLLDSLRGIAVLNMILFHFCWDLVYLRGVSLPGFTDLPGMIWERFICCTFLLISGFCWQFSRHPVKNGVTIFGCGALVTAVTLLVLPQDAVWFGVLTFLGSAMVLCLPLRRLVGRFPAVALAVCFALFLLCYPINQGVLTGGCALPTGWYQNHFTAYLGFPPGSFSSSDYFPLLPWSFLFLTGAALSVPMQKLRPPFLFWRCLPLEWIGRHALLLYLLHQPMLAGLALLF